ncbi:MetQ/NlpA family ABC transporter substrate-binding protein [Cohnella terricola]|uniref:MetQ/NlpA family ABC transporter substrate-binding protein n=1 Tax=Cohnella terricola TaxID=1289167 RepID=A0A559JT68_9BACL|nr:MetQ/NlpA family ABC transporter substrate-binding protein [Cohnella terricola]TVY03078.1 MetQ/NlpA family ABC transporter substrate-binding protein [Cohnella terricola]
MKKQLWLSLVVILAILVVTACGNKNSGNNKQAAAPESSAPASAAAVESPSPSPSPEPPKEPIKVKIGVTGSDGPQWPLFKEKAKKELNVDIQLIEFADYTLPNLALANNEVDINSFQHLAFLSKFNVEHNLDIVPIGSTVVAPLGLYSQKYKTVDEIPEGSKIAIPDDPSNQGRGLLVLQQAGLIKLKDNPGLFATPDDIVENPHKIKIVPVVAQQTPRVLPDVAASIINGGIAGQAGLKLADAIFHDDPKAESTRPYVNVFAVRRADVNNATYLELAKLYQQPDIEEAVLKDTNGASFVTNIPVEQLQQTLDQLIENIKAEKAK